MAEEFLRKLEAKDGWQFEEVEEYAPFLEKSLVDESIKLFSVSKKIVEVIFNSEGGREKRYYVVLVPCIMGGIGNKRFIVRKNIDRMVRHYIKNHTEVWYHNMIEKFAQTTNPKTKELLVDLMAHAYRSSPEFFHPYEKVFKMFDREISEPHSQLKRKVIDCVLVILDRHAPNQLAKENMLQVFTQQHSLKILRRLGKSTWTAESVSEEDGEVLSPILRKPKRQRMITAAPEQLQVSRDNLSEEKHRHISEEKHKRLEPLYSRDRKVRKSHI